MELSYYMGFVTPLIHFGWAILYIWNSPVKLVFCATRTSGGNYVPCISPSVTPY